MESVRAFRSTALAVLMLLSAARVAQATGPEDLVRPIRDRCAEVKQGFPEQEQAEQFHALALRARELADRNPYMAEPLVVEGIVLAAEAGARGGLEAYWLAKKSQRSFEESLKLDEKALGGAAYAGLATLHAKELVWPFGFGSRNNVRAEKYFRKALAINPGGIDTHLLYGEYLYGLYRLNEARTHLELAQKAALAPSRELADAGQLKDIRALLAKIEKDLKVIARPAGGR